MSIRKNTLTYAAAAVVIAALIIGAVIAFNPGIIGLGNSSSTISYSGGGTGTLNVYLTDAPPASLTLKYLLVNVTSISLRYEGNVSTSPPQNQFVFNVSASAGTNVNLTSLQGNSVLLGSKNMPAGNITSIVINITGARAFYTNGTSEQLKVVANGKLMVPIHFSIQKDGSTDLTIDITPNTIHTSQAGVLTPVIHVTTVERGPNNSTTTNSAETEVTTTESETNSTTSSSTSQATS